MECPCEEWISNLPIPSKVIGFICSLCKTQYTLFPNGEIMYEQRLDGLISSATHVAPSQST